ncbi:THUMP domain-containing protein 3-like [Harpegnathos saltator]|uniref:THUMP domain-containing protein 3-like n=1 Tax=Harpegnathos saltator TaxID=610380 RepID=UPI000DBEEF86|nr:THUMP domain-containing protein 3-like [Harpegnathos saltator]
MCGSGSIPIEATLACSHLCILCGDKNSKVLERTKSHIDGSGTAARINPVQWLALNLPLRFVC